MGKQNAAAGLLIIKKREQDMKEQLTDYHPNDSRDVKWGLTSDYIAEWNDLVWQHLSENDVHWSDE